MKEKINLNEEYFKKVNIDKALKKTLLPICIIAFSIFTYLYGYVFEEYDFGIIFEVASLILLLISIFFMKQYDEDKAKICINCAIGAVGWLLIYDLIDIFQYVEVMMDIIALIYLYVYTELILLIYIGLLLKVKFDLLKADNPKEYEEKTDWFYERPENENK